MSPVNIMAIRSRPPIAKTSSAGAIGRSFPSIAFTSRKEIRTCSGSRRCCHPRPQPLPYQQLDRRRRRPRHTILPPDAGDETCRALAAGVLASLSQPAQRSSARSRPRACPITKETQAGVFEEQLPEMRRPAQHRGRRQRTNSDDHANQECPDIEGHGFLLHHEETTRRIIVDDQHHRQAGPAAVPGNSSGCEAATLRDTPCWEPAPGRATK